MKGRLNYGRIKKGIYDKDNWYNWDGDYYFPEYYLGKGLFLDEATKLKEQRVKKYTENTNEYSKNVLLGKYGKILLLKLTNEAYMLNYWWM